jgi:hypothetical protein
MKRMLGCLALAVSVAGGSIGVAAPASASARTVAYNTTGTGPWNHPATRPAKILAPGYAPWGVRFLSWSSWKPSSASGHGQAFGYFNSECCVTKYPANIKLYDVKMHLGKSYFAKMEISARGHKTIWLSMHRGAWT